MREDFYVNKSKAHQKLVSELKNNIRSCNIPIEKQKEDTQTILNDNKSYLTSTIVPVISTIALLASVITTVISSMFNTYFALFFVAVFYICAVICMNSALKYKRKQNAYLKLKLKCIDEIMIETEKKKHFPQIVS